MGSGAAAVFGQAAGGNGTINAGFTDAVVMDSSNSLRVAGGTLVDTNGKLLRRHRRAGVHHRRCRMRSCDTTTAAPSPTCRARAPFSSGTGLTLGTGNFSGVIEGGPLLTLNGTGTLVLTGANTYSGGTTIANGGTLQIGAGGTSGNLGAGAVSNAGWLVFNRSDDITVANAIGGSGSWRRPAPAPDPHRCQHLQRRHRHRRRHAGDQRRPGAGRQPVIRSAARCAARLALDDLGNPW